MSFPHRADDVAGGGLGEAVADAALAQQAVGGGADQAGADPGQLVLAERVEHQRGLDAVPQLDREGGAGGLEHAGLVEAGRRRWRRGRWRRGSRS